MKLNYNTKDASSPNMYSTQKKRIGKLHSISEFDIILSSLKKEFEFRKKKDLQIITQTLEKTFLIQKLEKNEFDSTSLKRLLKHCASSLEYLYVQGNNFLFREGEIGDKFYIILKGSVKVMSLREKETKMNGEEYISYLSKLKNDKEEEALKLTIKANMSTFFADFKESHELHEILFLSRLKKKLTSYKSLKEIQDIFQEFNRNPLYYNINLNELRDLMDENVVQSKLNSIKGFIFSTSTTNYNKYLYTENTVEAKDIKIYVHEEIKDLIPGSYFGDYAFDSKTLTRTASIWVSENSHFGVLSFNTYKEHVKGEFQRLKIKECLFLTENFFKSFKSQHFITKFYTFFSEKQAFKGDTIFKEGDDFEKLLFIKEGKIELSIKVDPAQLDKKIHDLEKNFKNPDNIALDNQDSFSSKKIYDKKKKTFKLLIINEFQDIGLVEYFLKVPIICSATVISNKASFSIIKKEDFCKMLNEDISSKNELKRKVYERAYWFMNRFKELQVQFNNEVISEEGRKSISFREGFGERHNLLNNFQMTINTDYLDLVNRLNFNNSDINILMTKGEEIKTPRNQALVKLPQNGSKPREIVERFFKEKIKSKLMKEKETIPSDYTSCNHTKKSLISLIKHKSVPLRELLDSDNNRENSKPNVLRLVKIRKINDKKNVIEKEEIKRDSKISSTKLWVPTIINKKEYQKAAERVKNSYINTCIVNDNCINSFKLKNPSLVSIISNNISTSESSNENLCIKLPVFSKQASFFTIKKKNFKRNVFL